MPRGALSIPRMLEPQTLLGGGNLNNACMERARAIARQGRNMMDGMHTRVVNNMQRS